MPWTNASLFCCADEFGFVMRPVFPSQKSKQKQIQAFSEDDIVAAFLQ
jgi:hypothetical protein